MSRLNITIDSPMIVRNTEKDGFVRINQSFKSKIGFDNATLADKPFIEWISPGDRDSVLEALESVEKTCIAHHVTKDGKEFPLRIQFVKREEGVFVLARCVETLIQVKPEDESNKEATVLGTLDAIARIIEEQNPEFKCSILLVADGRFVSGAGPSLPEDYNSAIDGYAVGPNVGSCGTAIFWNVPVVVEDIKADPLWVPFAELAKKAGVSACWSHPFSTKKGKVLGALAFYSPVPRKPTREQLKQLKTAAEMTGLAVERGRAEEALRETLQRERELENQLLQVEKMKALGVLAGGIAHDFNNQLQPILSCAELLMESLEDEEQLEFAQIIFKAANHSRRTVSDLLSFARKKQIVESTPVDIHNMIRDVVALLQHNTNKKITISQNLNADKSIIESDPTQIQNMILNIALNANDAMPNGGDLEFITETVEIKENNVMPFNPSAGSYICIKVRDNGTGMDEETCKRIFEPFYTTKEIEKGTGMGLASTYGTTEKLKGTITFDSVLGKGTTFSLYLPLSEGSHADLSTSQESKMNRS
jgi:two-component system, cell cycle sensor histidine kinase and response regulator CckA